MNGKFPDGFVLAVCKNANPGVPKNQVDSIRLLEEFGVEGDYHAGKRSATAIWPRRILNSPITDRSCIDAQILGDLGKVGIKLVPGQMAENIVCYGINVMALEIGTRLAAGEALLEITEIRNPCKQLNESHSDLYQALIHEVNGEETYTAGVFARIIRGGKIDTGNSIYVYG